MEKEWFHCFIMDQNTGHTMVGYSDQYSITEKFCRIHSKGPNLKTGIFKTHEIDEADLRDMGLTYYDRIILKSSKTMNEVCYTTKRIWAAYRNYFDDEKPFLMYRIVGKMTEIMYILHECQPYKEVCFDLSKLIGYVANYDPRDVDDVVCYNLIPFKFSSFEYYLIGGRRDGV